MPATAAKEQPTKQRKREKERKPFKKRHGKMSDNSCPGRKERSASRYRAKFASLAGLVACVFLLDIKHNMHGSAVRKPIQVVGRRFAGTVYVCGYGKEYVNGSENNIVWKELFPNYQFNVANFSADMNSSSTDVYLSDGGGYGPLCKDIFSKWKDYAKWLDGCKGKILVTNPKLGTWKERGFVDKRIFQIGYNPESAQSIQMRFVQKMVLGLDHETREKLFDPAKKPTSTRDRFLIYASSNCVPFRDTAAALFSHVNVVDIGGSCNGATGDAIPQANNVRLAPNHVRNTPWRENGSVFGAYRFCLVLEKRNTVGYISEKILNAFLGGCIPIYYGEDFVFRIFNRKAFVFYDIDNPQAAMNQVRYLDSNATAYDQIIAEPILADGDRTVDEFFSLSDDIGNATLKRRIHTIMGLVPPT